MIKDSNQNKKPLIFYTAVAAIVIMLLNAFVFPMLLQRQVQEVGYSDFLKMVDSKQVSEVSMDENGEQLIFIAKGKDGQDGIYKTAVFPDNSLRQRLEDAGVSFSAQIPTRNNPLISFLISWVIPIALFWALGQILSRRMMGGMNALSFGKSGAKIVASESTGVTFEDVAGEEEAKEASEKKKEEKKEEAKKLEKEAMQQEMIENIKQHAAETQHTSADGKRAIARRERAEANTMGAEDAQRTIITEGASMEDTQNAVNSEITNILNKLSLLPSDVKGSTVDSQI